MSIGIYLPKKGEVGYNKVKNTGSGLLLMLLFFALFVTAKYFLVFHISFQTLFSFVCIITL